MPDSDTVVDSEARRSRRRKDVFAIWGPFADASVTGLEFANLSKVLLEVIDGGITVQVSIASNENIAAVRGELDLVPGHERKRVNNLSPGVEDGCFGRHVAIHHSKTVRLR